MVKQREKIKRDQKVVNETRSRDGDVCQCCGCGDGCEVHHIEPLFLGGEDALSNTICLCTPCHDDAPDNPERFLAYQRAGGTFWLECLKHMKGDDLKRAKSFSTSDRLNFIDAWRHQRWGWMTGQDVGLNQWHNGGKTFEEACQIAADHLELIQKALATAANLNPDKAAQISSILKSVSGQTEERLGKMLTALKFPINCTETESFCRAAFIERIENNAGYWYVDIEKASFSAMFPVPLNFAANLCETLLEISADLKELPEPIVDETGQFELTLAI